MLTLFHHPLYASCRFVRLSFGEYGEELALIEERPWARREEFLTLNPAGTIPVLLAEGDHPIVPIMLGDAVLATRMASMMLDEGVYVIGFSYPVVPKGTARIRVQLSAAHTREDIEFAMDAFARTQSACVE